MKKKWTVFLYMILLVLVSCEKDPPPEKTSYFMDDEFLANTVFKTGSWWVYEKDTLTPIDSIYVIKSEVTNVSHDSVDYNWQRSAMQYKSSLNGDTVTSLGDLEEASFTYYSKQKISTAPGSEALDFFSLKPVGYVLELSPTLKMRYDTVRDVLVDSLPYTNVKIFQNLVTPSSPRLPKLLWYAKNVGVVRKELFNGEVWSLVRYNVIQ
jgi:hypothetical protein